MIPYDMGCSFGQLGPATLALCPLTSRAAEDAEIPKYPGLCTALLTNNRYISVTMTWLSSQSQNMASLQMLWHQDAHQQPCTCVLYKPIFVQGNKGRSLIANGKAVSKDLIAGDKADKWAKCLSAFWLKHMMQSRPCCAKLGLSDDLLPSCVKALGSDRSE